MKKVIIGNKKIGGDSPPFIIVDVGANHNKDYDLALKLIDKAAEAGVDAVKFQSYRAETLYSAKAPQFSKDDKKPFDLIKENELPPEWLKGLSDHAAKKGIYFLASPFDYKAVDELYEIGIPAYKIASFEITDLEFLRYIASKNKPIILSTGMSSLGDIEEALSVIRSQNNEEIILLHCNSLYPTPAHVVNLNAIRTMEKAFGLPVGFSDHTLGIHIPIAAVAKGAKIIEKHFTLDRNMKGPDHSFAIEPDEMKLMVTYIKEAHLAEGTGIKERSEEEEEMYEKGRRSLIAAVDIPKETNITKEMLIIKRPGYGIKPKFLDIVVGRKAKINIEKDDIITWDMIGS